MKLSCALQALGDEAVAVPAPVSGDGDPVITGLSADSRTVVTDGLFAALPGVRADGRAFIAAAVERGARVVLAPPGTMLPEGAAQAGVVLLTHPNPRRALALLAAEFYGPQPSPIVAVTGTNGKTSTVSFARQLWLGMGRTGAVTIGTLGVQGDGLNIDTSMTTPDPVTLHRVLAQIRKSGGGPVALEASSHGLEQHRLDGVRLAATGFTNLSRDHLDHHHTMEAYLAAKLRLFSEVLPGGGIIVANADIPEAATLRAIGERRCMPVWFYGRNGADIRLVDSTPAPDGQLLRLQVLGYKTEVFLPLVGDFQAMNVLCALGLVLGSLTPQSFAGSQAPEIVELLATLKGAPGRLELVGEHPLGAHVYVDYAHTPDALESALRALRPHCAGRLVCVFGCGGDRDAGKRPVMGEIASRLADRVIVTDDNPRSEDPALIRAAILEQAPGAREIGDRAAAISEAVSGLGSGDVLLIAGKGHETSQVVGDRVYPFNDAEEARQAIRKVEEA
ncbi:UDP-N-acetylmuramoyl-L-alanyl-D-glutamate--2,6-diaminopimelate ligase [Phaeovibrio sulfidiphilus]|uniref:UDP-N-acetylmuramoyl-L-alanyl-D-glutamate--2,6-diaminopimelate ligase n=1 Tax=Phaeovibrio sulfidiphilus TaxID=1220600 RepID=A0A8J6YXK3_9PROT|nr:UDP-N-acetylmuramoyl-L-alanyl-D-glutamate--2,6-diaminopimelate ligase [Phaeovibrio sulfidiphilus]MBE1237512.1 UDP-N-acetylmuramoyl-L-alanyl-D-glutamate--2,6-diaminopimelate ligase [Phaeovibrio sulfidiphilus]